MATSTGCPFKPFRKSGAASSFTFALIDSGDTSLKSFGADVMPSSTVWFSLNSFSLRSELSDEATSVTVVPMLICPLNSKVSPVGLRTSFTMTGLPPRVCAVPVMV